MKREPCDHLPPGGLRKIDAATNSVANLVGRAVKVFLGGGVTPPLSWLAMSGAWALTKLHRTS